MDLIVKYIGNDLKYWTKLKQRFALDYPELNLHFITQNIDQDFKPRKSFVKTYQERPQIVFIDFSIFERECLSFCKLFNRNNTTRLSSLVALHEYRKGWDSINKALLAGVRINHFKSSEVQDVVYNPVSLLNVDVAKDPEFVHGKDLGHFHLKQILRLAYVEDDCFHVETTSLLPDKTIITLDSNPLPTLLQSQRVYVKSFSDTDLYYNSRFAYDLEFIYIDDKLFQATEQSWLAYKDFRDNPRGYREATGKRYDDLYDDVKRRKEKIRPMREGIRDWIKQESPKVLPKKVKLLVIDDSMEIFSELDDQEANFPYSINIQNNLTRDFYQIRRTRPHLICIHNDELNDLQMLQEMILNIKKFIHYQPYILVFNFDSTENLKEKFDYENLLTFKGNVHLDTIKKMSQRMDEKLNLSSNQNRVYFHTASPESILFYTRKVKVLAMSELTIYFESDVEIPMWTTFIMEDPTKMLVTVVPHLKESQFCRLKNCYRAMINGLGETEKQVLRRAINDSLQQQKN